MPEVGSSRNTISDPPTRAIPTLKRNINTSYRLIILYSKCYIGNLVPVDAVSKQINLSFLFIPPESWLERVDFLSVS